jgi:hypothetical protein
MLPLSNGIKANAELSQPSLTVREWMDSFTFDVERQPGDLGVLRGVIGGFSEEARTRGFAPLTFVRFAFANNEV